jgi:Uma2 family endonuclease
MVDAGILAEDDRLELLDGELIVASPQGPSQSALTARIHRLLEEGFGDGFHARDHAPLALGPHDLPEPDVALVKGEVDAFLTRHPAGGDVVLVVEISVTTQRTDRAKAAIYARAGVPLYWNVDVEHRRVTVHTRPDPEQGVYAVVTTLRDTDHTPLAGGTVPIARLLP